MTEARLQTTCPYCGVGCGIDATVSDGNIIAVEGSATHPANRGKLCVKGTTLPKTEDRRSRLLYPEIEGQRASWDQAIAKVAESFQSIINEHGPESVAMYLSGQLLTEDYYVANKLMKGFIGSANVDTNSRLCMSSAVAAYKRGFGEDVVPCDYLDFETAGLFVFVGSNAAWTHPVIFQKIVNAKARGAKVVVIDPRRTATCDIANLHLAIKPGSDVLLYGGLLSFIAANQYVDDEYIAQHTTGFESALNSAQVSVAEVAAGTGLNSELIFEFYKSFAQTGRVLTLFSQGVNQSIDGTDKGNAIINCHLATGKIGKPGAGPFSLTGQPNAMGGREVGGMANQLAAHLELDAKGCSIAKEFWQAPNMVTGEGRKAVDMFADIESGKIKAVWIMATNPAVSLPDSERVTRALTHCPVVVVSDVTRTDTTALANVLLPACGWGEKDGTVTNSERYVSRQRVLVPAPGEARPDWQVICEVAASLGFGDAFNYQYAHEIFSEHARLSGYRNQGERLFDISEHANLDRDAYDGMTPFQWPSVRPFANGKFQTPDGKARFVAISSGVKATHGMILNTGRIRDQWHTMTRTGIAAALYQHQSIAWLDISPPDAQRLNLETGDLGQLQQGSVTAHLPVRVDENLTRGQLFAPMHWSDNNSSHGRINRLVTAETDPVSGQPALKSAAVQLEKLSVHSWVEVNTSISLVDALRGNTDVYFWSMAKDDSCFVYHIAIKTGSVMSWLLDILREMTGSTNEVVFEDSLTGTLRGQGYEEGVPVWLVKTTDRLSEGRSTGLPVANGEEAGWQNLSVFSVPPGANSPRVCTCFEVSEHAISEAVLSGIDTVEALGKALKCGTNCGSCIPEINRLITRLADDKIEKESAA